MPHSRTARDRVLPCSLCLHRARTPSLVGTNSMNGEFTPRETRLLCIPTNQRPQLQGRPGVMDLASMPSQNRPRREFLPRERTDHFHTIHLASTQKKHSEQGLQPFFHSHLAFQAKQSRAFLPKLPGEATKGDKAQRGQKTPTVNHEHARVTADNTSEPKPTLSPRQHCYQCGFAVKNSERTFFFPRSRGPHPTHCMVKSPEWEYAVLLG